MELSTLRYRMVSVLTAETLKNLFKPHIYDHK
jgi:hypothetical protein